jgi:hypothetical protein
MPSGLLNVASCHMLDGGTTVQQKCALIDDALSKIDSTLVATNIQHLIHGDWRRQLEQVIIQTLADTNPDELNYMLPRIKLGLIMYKVKVRRRRSEVEVAIAAGRFSAVCHSQAQCKLSAGLSLGVSS